MHKSLQRVRWRSFGRKLKRPDCQKGPCSIFRFQAWKQLRHWWIIPALPRSWQPVALAWLSQLIHPANRPWVLAQGMHRHTSKQVPILSRLLMIWSCPRVLITVWFVLPNKGPSLIPAFTMPWRKNLKPKVPILSNLRTWRSSRARLLTLRSKVSILELLAKVLSKLLNGQGFKFLMTRPSWLPN